MDGSLMQQYNFFEEHIYEILTNSASEKTKGQGLFMFLQQNQVIKGRCKCLCIYAYRIFEKKATTTQGLKITI